MTKRNVFRSIADDLDRTELKTAPIILKTLDTIMFTRFKLPLIFVCLVSASQMLHARTLNFSGATWTVKTSTGKAGPGPNYFSDSPSNVAVDAHGHLHLRITHNGDRWQCAEVIHTASLGYGTYRFYLATRVDDLDPNIVLGLFTWRDETAYSHREIDFEFSRLADPSNHNAQYVVQPYTKPGHILRFGEPSKLDETAHSFLWQRDSVLFQSLRGAVAKQADAGKAIHQWRAIDQIPAAGGENVRMNLWLFRGQAPTNGRETEVIISRFEFVPLR